jgi:hypothetical protein
MLTRSVYMTVWYKRHATAYGKSIHLQLIREVVVLLC